MYFMTSSVAPVRRQPPFPRSGKARRPSLRVGRGLECPDVELRHPHQGVQHALRPIAVRPREELRQDGGDDLPRQAVAVLEPPALPPRAARRQLLPQPVQLLLRLAVHRQRHRLVEPELRPPVECEELDPGQPELDDERRAGRAGGDARDAGVLEGRDVERGGLFGVPVEPQAGFDLLCAFTKRCPTVHYSECACGSLGQWGSIGLPSDGPSAFLHPARSRPLASWWMVAPTSALQDFPVPRNLAPEDVAGEGAFLSFRWVTATAPRHSCGSGPRPPHTGTRTRSALAGHTSRSPSRCARTSGRPPRCASPASPGGRSPRSGWPAPPGCSSAPHPAS